MQQEYALVFPQYYFGQIFEAKHEPGTVAYSMELQLKLLQETTDEMARNGCKKIIIVNGHGGNEHQLPFFAQAQLDRPHDYVVYVLDGERSRPGGPPKKSTGIDYHAGENETSNTMVSRPDLVHLDRAANESGADQKRLNLPEDIYTGIWWYGRFPNHYSGDGSVATRELERVIRNGNPGQWHHCCHVRQLDRLIGNFQRVLLSCPTQRRKTSRYGDSTSINSRPMPIRGFTMRTTPRASTLWSFRVRIIRTRAFDGNGLLVQMNVPPMDMSDVTPSAFAPLSMSSSSASAANG